VTNSSQIVTILVGFTVSFFVKLNTYIRFLMTVRPTNIYIKVT